MTMQIDSEFSGGRGITHGSRCPNRELKSTDPIGAEGDPERNGHETEGRA
jgi:hypothetical protein